MWSHATFAWPPSWPCALALACTYDEPQVCARRVHPRVLDQLREPGRQALAILSAKLPQAPGSVVEVAYEDLPSLPNPRPDADVLFAEVHTSGSGRWKAPSATFCGPF